MNINTFKHTIEVFDMNLEKENMTSDPWASDGS